MAVRRLQPGQVIGGFQLARLACVNVLKLSRIALDEFEDEQGRNLHLQRLAELRHWARPLALSPDGITYHVMEPPDPAAAILEYAVAALPRQRVVTRGRRGALHRDSGQSELIAPRLPPGRNPHSMAAG